MCGVSSSNSPFNNEGKEGDGGSVDGFHGDSLLTVEMIRLMMIRI